MANAPERILDVLKDAGTLGRLGLAEWDLLIRQARLCGVLCRLAVFARECSLLDDVPTRIRPHLDSALLVAAEQLRAMRWEIRQIGRAVAHLDVPVVLLKGAGYLVAELPPRKGRHSSDIDLLVPRARVDDVDQALKIRGWQAVALDPRDARYYRTWLHELPALRHPHRKLRVDLHHTIVPLTDRLTIDPQSLIDRAQEIKPTGLYVLDQPDMVLHSIIHLFRNGDLESGLRDLTDMHDLLADFGRDSRFWERLLDRAAEWNAGRSLYYALRYLHTNFEMTVPDSIVGRLDRWRPNVVALSLMDRLVGRSLIPRRLDGCDRQRDAAIWLFAHLVLPRFRALFSPLFWLKRLPNKEPVEQT